MLSGINSLVVGVSGDNARDHSGRRKSSDHEGTLMHSRNQMHAAGLNQAGARPSTVFSSDKHANTRHVPTLEPVAFSSIDLVGEFNPDLAIRDARLRARYEGDALSTTDICRIVGVTARTVRFYEERGLLAPDRSGRDRRFTGSDIQRLKTILTLSEAGLSLQEIHSSLNSPSRNQGTTITIPTKHLQNTIDSCKDRVGSLVSIVSSLQKILDQMNSPSSVRSR